MKLQQLTKIIVLSTILTTLFTSCSSSDESYQVSAFLDISQTWNAGEDNSKDDFSIYSNIGLNETKPDLSEIDFKKGRLLSSGLTVKSEELKSGDKIVLTLTVDNVEKFEVSLTAVQDKTKEVYATIDYQNSDYTLFVDDMINRLVRNKNVSLQVAVKLQGGENIPFRYMMSNSFEVYYKY